MRFDVCVTFFSEIYMKCGPSVHFVVFACHYIYYLQQACTSFFVHIIISCLFALLRKLLHLSDMRRHVPKQVYNGHKLILFMIVVIFYHGE